MDIETIKQVIEMVNQLGVNGKDAFITWLIVTNASTYIFGLIWSIIAACVLRGAYVALMGWHNLCQLRDAAGISCYFTAQELRRACAILRKYYQDPSALD
jgi:hypothetical protein